jgi:hypothetical protein
MRIENFEDFHGELTRLGIQERTEFKRFSPYESFHEPF